MKSTCSPSLSPFISEHKKLLCLVVCVSITIGILSGGGVAGYLVYDYYYKTNYPSPVTVLSYATCFLINSTFYLSWTLPETEKVSRVDVYNDLELVSSIYYPGQSYLLEGTENSDAPQLTLVALRADGSEHSRTKAAIFNTGLPTLFVNTKDSEPVIDKERKIDANVILFDATGTSAELDIDDFSTTIKGRGQSSWDKPKKGYNLKFKKKQSILGMPKSKKWSLIANYVDKTLLRNSYASYLGKEIFNTSWAPEYKQVNFIMNGQYLGTYVIAEAVKLDEGRVNVTDIADVDEEGGDLREGGFILEVDARMSDNICFKTNQLVPLCMKDPDEASEGVQERVKDIANRAEAALYGHLSTDPVAGYAHYLHIPSVIDWYLINEFTRNVDSPFHHSGFMYYDPSDGLLHMGPIWDFDLSAGNAHHNSGFKAKGWWVKKIHPHTKANWITELWKDKKFRKQVKARWMEKRSAVEKSFTEILPAMVDELREGADANFFRWPILGKSITFSSPGHLKRKTYSQE